ncbi:diguanylate cyclase DgcJ [Escherichia fergusonii]|uniref:diguanylate cyclase DgcJ n=1 Tax=Escherichia fergusonii TaxID=564 RepID=UPI00209BA354|nr:diguanylate cyclase DgcJ [Escherichia fergusonii]MCO7985987.1 diguanylate cyclase DgcJ [Escherichia fergusonii]
MKLHHRMLRHFIAASVIILTSSFLIYELIASDRAMTAYLHYIVQRADSSFLYDKYQNQSIAAHLMRAFATPREPISDEQKQDICRSWEIMNGIYGMNLVRHTYPGLHGTLQSTSADCNDLAEDISLLPAFDQAVKANRHQDDYGKGLGLTEEKFHYYLDLSNRYVYFYEQIDSENFIMNNWSFLHRGTMGIDHKILDNVFTGRTVLSSIYKDNLTGKNIMSFLTPVYRAGQLKGMVLVDIDNENLYNIFYTRNRPLAWQYLNVTLSDLDSGQDIVVHKSESNLFSYVKYVQDLPGGMRITLSLDILYFFASSWKAFAFYLVATALLLNMVRMHFRLYFNVTRENISDAMTGLYNRKILTSSLEQRLQRLAETGKAVFFISLDLDNLKVINDTLGHHEGDLAISLLAKAIKSSVRKSDYAIRLGGDEFCVILIDSTEETASGLADRIAKKMHSIAPDKDFRFSSGYYRMKPGDTLNDAYKASDAQLYINKHQHHMSS